ncbi:alpha/beta fold hydrolase [Dactylosporangium darangshiense]|uniref:Alpha/beta hydrolase n=2 Tax=Dactylosporangium darangshiense TaxID=579108 RepID=A0ABP8DW24_9ACTN
MKLLRAPRRALAALATALTALGIVFLANSASAQGTTTPKPTVVLVHGAFADASGWEGVITRLRHDGYPVIAPATPLRGLSSDAAYIASVVKSVTGPVILVGHSYGGAVITNAARGLDNVKALVYAEAFIPDQGEATAVAANPAKYPNSQLGPDTLLQRAYPNPSAPGGVDQDLYINPQFFRRVFAADVSAAQAEAMALSQRPLAQAAFLEPSGAPAWKTIPSWALIATEDHAIDPDGARYMAKRAGAHITEVRASHVIMVTHPDAVVRVIIDADKHS